MLSRQKHFAEDVSEAVRRHVRVAFICDTHQSPVMRTRQATKTKSSASMRELGGGIEGRRERRERRANYQTFCGAWDSIECIEVSERDRQTEREWVQRETERGVQAQGRETMQVTRARGNAVQAHGRETKRDLSKMMPLQHAHESNFKLARMYFPPEDAHNAKDTGKDTRQGKGCQQGDGASPHGLEAGSSECTSNPLELYLTKT